MWEAERFVEGVREGKEEEEREREGEEKEADLQTCSLV